MIVTRGLGARGVLPTAGLGFNSYGAVLVVAPTQIAVGGWLDRSEDKKLRRNDDLEVIGLLVAFLNTV